MGLCALYADRQPSLLVDPGKSLFYCYGCGRGGDVIRFVELFHGVPFGEALAVLRRWSGVGSLLNDVDSRYINLKRALGRRFDMPARTLQSLDRFLQEHSAQYPNLNAAAFEAWCHSYEHVS